MGKHFGMFAATCTAQFMSLLPSLAIAAACNCSALHVIAHDLLVRSTCTITVVCGCAYNCGCNAGCNYMRMVGHLQLNAVEVAAASSCGVVHAHS